MQVKSQVLPADKRRGADLWDLVEFVELSYVKLFQTERKRSCPVEWSGSWKKTFWLALAQNRSSVFANERQLKARGSYAAILISLAFLNSYTKIAQYIVIYADEIFPWLVPLLRVHIMLHMKYDVVIKRKVAKGLRKLPTEYHCHLGTSWVACWRHQSRTIDYQGVLCWQSWENPVLIRLSSR